MRFYADTHRGLVRADNQDRFLVRELAPETFLMAVADGMGGQPAGNQAATMVTDMVRDFALAEGPVLPQMEALVAQINAAVLAAGKADSSLENMGSTLTLALTRADGVHWIHVGDCRLYHFNDALTQVTVDQNMAQGMLERGELTPDEARVAPFRNLLDQYVGFPELEPAAGFFSVHPGDKLLLCSDGLHGELSQEIIATVLKEHLPPGELVEVLFAAALQAGARDNITAALLEIPLQGAGRGLRHTPLQRDMLDKGVWEG